MYKGFDSDEWSISGLGKPQKYFEEDDEKKKKKKKGKKEKDKKKGKKDKKNTKFFPLPDEMIGGKKKEETKKPVAVVQQQRPNLVLSYSDAFDFTKSNAFEVKFQTNRLSGVFIKANKTDMIRLSDSTKLFDLIKEKNPDLSPKEIKDQLKLYPIKLRLQRPVEHFKIPNNDVEKKEEE